MAAQTLLRIQVITSNSTKPKIQTQSIASNSWLSSFNLQSFITKPILRKHHQPQSVRATISFSLPTTKTDVVSSNNVPKWSERAIKSFGMAELEARKLKYPTTGTEALLMGVLIEGTSLASKFLRANGITIFKVREETIKLLGKADMYFFSPEHPPLTEATQRVLDWSVDEAIKSGDGGEITTTHLILGIWSEVESPGHKVMAALGFNEEKLKQLKSLSSKPGSHDQ